MVIKKILGAALTFLAVGCARAPIKSVDQSMRKADAPREIQDDLALLDLGEALLANIERLKAISGSSSLRFGKIEIEKSKYVESLEYLLSALNADSSGELFLKTLKSEFDFYEVYGGDSGWGSVFVTSYYEPVIKGSLKKNKTYTQALYEAPSDMIKVDVKEFARVFPILESYQSVVIEKSRDGALRGRLIKEDGADRLSVVPYYSREEIDVQGKIRKTAKVICYVEPIDAFFLQIQGSGRVELTNGKELRVGYAAQNGHGYRAIGKALFDIIPKEEMTAQKIKNHLRSLPADEAQKIMNLNPSYVFFQKQESEPLSFFGTEVVAGRTIATDQMYFPKGALAYLQYEKPIFSDDESDVAQEFTKSSRFVLDQDTGGAIRGPGRVDLFWGRGKLAAQASGVMRNPGRLYYILPKKNAL
ncbi:MAG: murein transglycosylase A [Bdellovibrionales bacterium]|nr:murein transglycosylase A [Bdellovibrionales bacterium]